MPFELYNIFYGIKKDGSGKKPIDINPFDKRRMEWIGRARTDEELTMFFEDYFWAKINKYYLRNLNNVDDGLVGKLAKILCEPEDKRLGKPSKSERLPKRRKRTYDTGLPLPF